MLKQTEKHDKCYQNNEKLSQIRAKSSKLENFPKYVLVSQNNEWLIFWVSVYFQKSSHCCLNVCKLIFSLCRHQFLPQHLLNVSKKCSDCETHWAVLTKRCHLLVLEKWRPQSESELQFWQPEEEVAGPSPRGRTCPSPAGPGPASETWTQTSSQSELHRVNLKPHRESEVWSAASPGQLEESVLSILLLSVRGLTVVFIKVGSHFGPVDVCVLFALRDLEDKKKKKKSLVSVRTTKRSYRHTYWQIFLKQSHPGDTTVTDMKSIDYRWYWSQGSAL